MPVRQSGGSYGTERTLRLPNRSNRPALRTIAALLLAIELVTSIVVPTPALAKEFAMIAIVDCGVKSGKPCPDGMTIIGVRTDQISGTLQTHKVDFGWVLKHAPRLHQDEEICVEVRDDVRTDGILQAIAFIDKCDGPARRIKKDEDDLPPAPGSDRTGQWHDPAVL